MNSLKLFVNKFILIILVIKYIKGGIIIMKTFIIVILIFLLIMILIDGLLFDEMKRLERQLYIEKKKNMKLRKRVKFYEKN